MNESPMAGDIILYPVSGRSSFASRLVAIGQLIWGVGHKPEAYSHAAIMDVGGYQYEARWPKTGRFRIDHKRPYEVWRLPRMTPAKRCRIIAWCQDHEGEWYDLAALLFGWIQFRHAYVCSEFVGLAYESAGFVIGFEGKRLLAPNAIADVQGARLIRKHEPKRK